MHVDMTEAETAMATWVGRQRMANVRRHCRDPGAGSSRDDAAAEQNHIRGAMCEYAASIAFNLYWRPAIGRVRGHRDVGGLIEVRSKDAPHKRLIIKPKDVEESPHAPFVLVDCTEARERRFRIAGWIIAADAPRVVRLMTGAFDDAYFLAEDKLLPPPLLAQWIIEARGKREEKPA